MNWQSISNKCREIRQEFDKSYKCLNIDRTTKSETINKHFSILIQCLENIKSILNTYYDELTHAHKTAAEDFFNDIHDKIKKIAQKKNIILIIPDSIQSSTKIKFEIPSKEQKLTTMTNLDINELSIISKLVPKFSGKNFELNDFVVNLETVNTTIPTEKHTSFFNFIFKTKLDLKVQNRLKQNQIPTNINELLTSLKTAYKTSKTPNTILNEIINIKQKDNNIIGFATKIENLITELNELQIGENEANRNSVIKINDTIAFNSFMNGLRDPQVISTIDASQITTFPEAVKIAERATSRTKPQQIFQFQQKQCIKCGKNHGNRCPANNIKCHNCGKYNHYSNMCRSKRNYKTYNNNNRYSSNKNFNNNTGDNNRNYNNYNNNNNNRNNNNNNGNNYRNNNNNSNNNQRRQNNKNHNVHQIQDQGNLENPEYQQPGTPQGIN